MSVIKCGFCGRSEWEVDEASGLYLECLNCDNAVPAPPVFYKAGNAIEAAREVLGKGEMASSAALCLNDAEKHFAEGKFEYALNWAKKSVSYSVGMFSPVYKELAA